MANIKPIRKLNMFEWLRTTVAAWNASPEKSCVAPVVLAMPLSVQKMNQYVVRWDDNCKVHLFLTRYNTGVNVRRSFSTNWKTGATTNHNFELYLVKPYAGTGTQVHNESNDDTPNLIDETLSELLECFALETPFIDCDLYDFEVTAWQAYPVIYAEDMNYTGWRIVGTFEQEQNINKL